MAYGQQDLVAVVIYPDTAHPHTQHCHGPAWLPSSYRLLAGRFRGKNRMQVKGGSPEMGTRSIQDCLPEDVLGTRPLPCLPSLAPNAFTHVIHSSKDRSNMEGGHRRQVIRQALL